MTVPQSLLPCYKSLFLHLNNIFMGAVVFSSSLRCSKFLKVQSELWHPLLSADLSLTEL